jgi:hypothetical protein
MDLERERRLTIIGYGDWDVEADAHFGAAARNRAEGPVQLYGTDPARFLEMINGLLLEKLIAGFGADKAIAGLFAL